MPSSSYCIKKSPNPPVPENNWISTSPRQTSMSVHPLFLIVSGCYSHPRFHVHLILMQLIALCLKIKVSILDKTHLASYHIFFHGSFLTVFIIFLMYILNNYGLECCEIVCINGVSHFLSLFGITLMWAQGGIKFCK